MTTMDLDENVIKVLPSLKSVLAVNASGESAWAKAARVDVEHEDDSTESYFMKVSKGPHGRESLKGEFESTAAIYAITPEFCPKPIAWGTFNSEGIWGKSGQVTLFAHISWGRFGFHVVTYNGDLPQDNTWSESWEAFFLNGFQHVLRVREQRGGKSSELDDLLPDMFGKVIPRLLRPLETGGNHIQPSLVHGDLWCGNAAMIDEDTEDGIVFDPSSFWGHNEYELGNWRPERNKFTRKYFNAYHAHCPKSAPEADYDDRNALYAMRFNLNAATLFPSQSTYLNMVIEEMKRLIAKFPSGYEGDEARSDTRQRQELNKASFDANTSKKIPGENKSRPRITALCRWFRKRSLIHVLSRQDTDRSDTPTAVARSTTVQSNLSLLDLSGDAGGDKGPLGLSTLFEPEYSTPEVDLIFVHGLGGGSRKSWSKSPDPLHFWPKAWLPGDPEFSCVRIHTFGYKADWGERRQSMLSIHDFAQSLLGELKNDPLIRRDNTRLILVGHSMGGCVAKKAYILARQDASSKNIADRIQSIFFLGTPHRGSDLASILQNMLAVAWGSKPYVNDLLPNCATLAEINDVFRHYAGDLRLWSFYETLPVNAKVLNKIVVEKYSATLGYGNEEIAAMDADHRHVCKFDTQSDPNYKKLRNALCTAIDLARVRASSATSRDTLLKVELLLGISDATYEDDLMSLQELRHPGSCSWLFRLPDLTDWLVHSGRAAAPIFWLTGRPATGKSVLSSYVIDKLRETGFLCSYFFFKHGKAGRSSLTDCLRGIAHQMATQDQAIALQIEQLDRDGESWDLGDEKSIWRKLFVNGIFKTGHAANHVWVIDGIDECSKSSNWFRLTPQLPPGFRLFMTSRSNDEIERGLHSLGPRVQVQPLVTSDTAQDMHAFLRSKLEDLSLENIDELCNRILTKSQGSFLWVRLVLQEFENAYTDEDIEAILKEVPEDLYQMYTRMLATIQSERRRSKLAKSILTWVALAGRPLSIDELRCAVRLDINETPHNIEKAIPTVCGQLVFVDQSSRVHMIHETAREFILDEDLDSTLAVRKGERHGHLASLLCKYLSTDVLKNTHGFKPARTSKLAAVLDASLVDYASKFFSEHLYRSNSVDDAPMRELCIFLRTNILFWLETIAGQGELQPINRTAVNLAGYLRRRTKYVPPVDKDIQLIDSWAIDLIRVSARFRSKLLACPSAIHYLIPPFCPTESMISTMFIVPTRSLTVKGSRETEWDDCLVRVDFAKGQTTALAHGSVSFAVGLSTGQVSLYDAGSIQHISLMRHPERVRTLEFSPDERVLAVAGQKHISIWEPRSGNEVWTKRLTSPPLAMAFVDSEYLIHVNRANQIITTCIENGDDSIISWGNRNAESSLPHQPPSRATISTNMGLLAVGYRSHPISIIDLHSGTLVGQCSPGKANGIDAMSFNPSPDVFALVVSNQGGDLLVFDPRTAALEFQRSNVFAHTLSCSVDGRSLVTGDSRGTVEIYEFDGPDSTALTLIYRIGAHEEGVKDVRFSEDGLRIVDCRESQVRVWEPAILVQKDADIESQSDISSQVTIAMKMSGSIESAERPEITSLVPIVNGDYIVCGKSNGEVSIWCTADGNELKIIYSHSCGASVVAAAVADKYGIVATADESGRVLVVQMKSTTPYWQDAHILVDRRVGCAISNMMVSPSQDRLLISGKTRNELWDLSSGDLVCTREHTTEGMHVMFAHPRHRDTFISCTGTAYREFSWSAYEETEPRQEIQLMRTNQVSQGNVVSASYHGSELVLESLKVTGDGAGVRTCYWSGDDFDQARGEEAAILGSSIELLNPILREVITVIGSTVIFIDKELWICSLDLTTFNTAPYAKRHFFILSEWLNVNGDMKFSFTHKKEFVFVNKSNLVIIKGGLEFSEVVALSPKQGWTVQTGSMHRRTSSSMISTPG
ncbi:WD40 repeat-like protein [Apiospora arundinis]